MTDTKPGGSIAAMHTLDEIRRNAAIRAGAGAERELRTVPNVPTEFRADEDTGGGTLFGHAAVFDVETVIGQWFREKIAPGAFTKTIKEADVRHLYNHNPDLVLARTKNGTLRLSEDDIGLAFEADLNPEDPDAVSVKAKVARGDVDQSSFAFRVIREEWEDGDVDENDGTRRLPLRTVLEARLYDTSSVTYPAYEEADTGLRAMGLGILSNILGLSEGARSVILRQIEKGGDIPAELQSAVDEFRSALDRAATRDPDETSDEAGDAANEDAPAAEEAPAPGDEPAGEEPEPAAEEAPEEVEEDQSELEEIEAMRARHRHLTRLATTKE